MRTQTLVDCGYCCTQIRAGSACPCISRKLVKLLGWSWERAERATESGVGQRIVAALREREKRA